MMGANVKPFPKRKNRYRMGYIIEIRARKQLIEKGAIVVRSARSLTPIDLVAIFPLTKEIWLIQAKKAELPKNTGVLARKFSELAQIKGLFTVRPMVYMKKGRKYEFVEV